MGGPLTCGYYLVSAMSNSILATAQIRTEKSLGLAIWNLVVELVLTKINERKNSASVDFRSDLL